MVKILIEFGALINYQQNKKHIRIGSYNNSIKMNPLHWASSKGFHKIIQVLLEHNMDYKDYDFIKNNSFHLACSSNDL